MEEIKDGVGGHYCEPFQKAIQFHDIKQFRCWNVAMYYIIGHPLLVDDGDGFWDEPDNDVRIYYCPFCGKVLPEVFKD